MAELISNDLSELHRQIKFIETRVLIDLLYYISEELDYRRRENILEDYMDKDRIGWE